MKQFFGQIYVDHTKKVPVIDVWKKTIKALGIAVHAYIKIWSEISL